MEAKKTNLVLDVPCISVLGTIRSGKTLIGRALNMHPFITVLTEPYFFFFKLCRNIFHRDILKEKVDFDRPMSPDFYTPDTKKNLFTQTFPELRFNEDDIQTLRSLTIWQQESVGGERAPKIISFLHLLREGNAEEVLQTLLSILARAYPKKNAKYVGFSEAWCEGFIGPLLNMPGIAFKCVHVIRDPRAVIASRNAGKNLKKEYGGKYPILFLIRNWRSSVAYSVVYANDPCYFVVKYEDLLRAPRKWFGRICNFLNLEFDDRLMHPEKFVNGSGKPWKQNTNFEVGNGFSVNSINRWQRILTPQEISFIEWMCRPEMEYLGYELTQKDYDLHRLTGYFEDEIELVEWLRPYNLSVSDEELYVEITRRYLLKHRDFMSRELIRYFFVDEKVYQTLVRDTKRSNWRSR